jgi:hypothetical protein
MWRIETHDHRREPVSLLAWHLTRISMIKGAGKQIPLSTIRLLGKMYYFFQLFLTVLNYFVYAFTPQRNLHLNFQKNPRNSKFGRIRLSAGTGSRPLHYYNLTNTVNTLCNIGKSNNLESLYPGTILQ